MLGMGDGWIVLAWVLCLASMVGGVIIGVLNWNRGDKANGS